MKSIVRQKWVGPEAYVEVRYTPNWSNDGLGAVDIFCFIRDPRKEQYHKPKYWVRGSTHGLVNQWNNWTDSHTFAVRNAWYDAAAEICKELGLTSSDRRAMVS